MDGQVSLQVPYEPELSHPRHQLKNFLLVSLVGSYGEDLFKMFTVLQSFNLTLGTDLTIHTSILTGT